MNHRILAVALLVLPGLALATPGFRPCDEWDDTPYSSLPSYQPPAGNVTLAPVSGNWVAEVRWANNFGAVWVYNNNVADEFIVLSGEDSGGGTYCVVFQDPLEEIDFLHVVGTSAVEAVRFEHPTTAAPLSRPNQLPVGVVRTYGGDDTISADAVNIPLLLVGGRGGDNVIGGTEDDCLIGGRGFPPDFSIAPDEGFVDANCEVQESAAPGDGTDYIFGGAGNDTLIGCEGTDHMYGEAGTDTLMGDFEIDDTAQLSVGEADILDGGTGPDYIVGGPGGDSIYGGACDVDPADPGYQYECDDILVGDFGLSTVVGGADYIFGEAGSDLIYGDLGADRIEGGTESDNIFGGAGKDLILGDCGDFPTGNDPIDCTLDTAACGSAGAGDTIDGGSWADQICGQAGVDHISGGAGGDRIWGGAAGDFLNGDDGADHLYGEDGSDTLRGGAQGDSLFGGPDGDFLFGDEGGDNLWGEDGVDELNGGDDSDWLFGGPQGDVLNGDDGPDFLHGDDGVDTLNGGPMQDYLFGGPQDDTLNGDGGADFLYGEGGSDTMDGGSEDDELCGGMENDSYTGGSGQDVLLHYLPGGVYNAQPNPAFPEVWVPNEPSETPTFASAGANNDTCMDFAWGSAPSWVPFGDRTLAADECEQVDPRDPTLLADLPAACIAYLP